MNRLTRRSPIGLEEGLAGVIAVNTSLNRRAGTKASQTGRTRAGAAGGLSGAPLRQRAQEVIRRQAGAGRRCR